MVGRIDLDNEEAVARLQRKLAAAGVDAALAAAGCREGDTVRIGDAEFTYSDDGLSVTAGPGLRRHLRPRAQRPPGDRPSGARRDRGRGRVVRAGGARAAARPTASDARGTARTPRGGLRRVGMSPAWRCSTSRSVAGGLVHRRRHGRAARRASGPGSRRADRRRRGADDRSAGTGPAICSRSERFVIVNRTGPPPLDATPS